MKAGDEVRHPSLGAGAIVSLHTRGGQAGADVDFGYMTDWVPASELGLDAGSTTPSHGSFADDVGVERPVVPSLTAAVVDARRGVLALKLGQVLEQHVLQLSTGTDSVQAVLETVVERGVQRRAQGVLIEGGWGSGKTHLLAMLRAIATSKGMATSSVILDGDGVRLSDPMRLMEAALESLRYPGEAVPCGIGARLRLLRRSGVSLNSQFRDARRIAHAINALPASAFDDPETLEILEDFLMLSLSATQARTALKQHGYRVRLPSMAARSVSDRPGRFRELLEGWAEFVTQTGAKGLALIVDEVDVDYASTTGRAAALVDERERRKSLLSALSKSLRKNLPLVVAFGSAPAEDEVPEEDDAVQDVARWVGESALKIIQAPQPDLPHMRQIVQHVIDLYESGYTERLANVDHDLIVKLRDTLAESYMEEEISPVPRMLVRRALEYLDVLPENLDLLP